MYMNLLLKTRLAAIPFRGRDRPLPMEELASFGNKQLFAAEGFTYNISLDDVKIARKYEKPLDWTRPWEFFEGSIQSMSEGAMVIINKETGKQRYFTTDRTTIIQNELDTGSGVCVYALAEDNQLPLAKVVACKAVNEMIASCFESISVKANALKEFLLLIEKEQRVLTSFLMDEGFSQKCFRAIAYLTTCVNAGLNMMREENIRHSLEMYKEESCENVPMDDVCTLLEADDVKRILYTDPNDPRDSSPWITFLMLWAVLHDKNGLECGMNKAETLLQRWHYRYLTDLAVGIGKLCSENELNDLVDELLRLIQDETPLKGKAERLLLELLFLDCELGRDKLYNIVNELFAETINTAQLASIPKLKQSPHINWIRAYITDRFEKSFREGNPLFSYLWTALWCHDQLGHDPLRRAEQYILEEPGTQAALVGMCALSLTAWSRRMGQGAMFWEFRMKNCTFAMQRALYHYLVKPDRRFYRFAVALVEDMVLNGLLEPKLLLRKNVAQATLNALKDPELAGWAEDLLVLFPGEISVDVQTLREKYAMEFEQALENKDTDELLRVFRLAMNCRAWEDKNVIYQKFAGLIDVYSRRELAFHFEDKEGIHPDGYAYLRLTMKELMTFFQDYITETPVEALEVLSRDLPLNSIQDCLKTVDFLWEDPEAKLELCTAKQLAEFLAIFRAVEKKAFDYREQTQKLRDMARRARVTAADLGSMMIINWMNVLVRYDLAEEALQFYRKNRTVLDRPVRYHSTKAHHGFNRFEFFDLNRWIKSRSRMEEALRFAADLGSKRVLAIFREAEEKLTTYIAELPNAPKQDEFDRKIRVLSQLNDDFPQAPVTKGFSRFYDDRGLVKYILENEHVPELETAVKELGYR